MKKYKQLLESTIIPSVSSNDEKAMRYTDFLNYVSAKLPSKLYRFRQCSQNNISAFYKDELWFSNGSLMNDDFDARLFYDKKKICEWLNSAIAEDGSLKVVESLLNMDKVPPQLMSIFPNAESLFNLLKNMPRDNIIFISSQIINSISGNIDNGLKNITDDVQSRTKFACFTEKIYSDMMWGHYANNATGFALEYKFDNYIITYKKADDQRNTIWGNLFPILYDNQRMDTTAYAIYLFQVYFLKNVMQINGFPYTDQLINMILPCPDEFMVTKLAIKKSNDWKPEKEWRMFYTTNNSLWNSEKCSCVKQKPSAVYLGRKISDINKKIILDIANEKGIPAYIMGFNENSRSYRLRSYKINKLKSNGI